MGGFKFYLKYKFGLAAGIPAAVINRVEEKDNAEPLVDIKQMGANLFFGDRLKDKNQVLLRKSVAEKVVAASEKLPDGVFFIIYDAYRSLDQQKQSWDKKYKYFKDLYPTESEDQIIKRTRAVVADPRAGHGGHQTGGAIDIGLCDGNGMPLDMGTPYSGTGRNIRTKSSEISEQAQKNRNLLYNVLTQIGFVNYPNEWWHYCYGDRMWAAYKAKSECFYGMVK